MPQIKSKVDYVRSQKRVQNHKCHWPDCDKQVPPAKWGCSTHWRMLPLSIRSAIWRTYIPGQEIKRNPTKEYIFAAQQAQKWIRKNAIEKT